MPCAAVRSQAGWWWVAAGPEAFQTTGAAPQEVVGTYGEQGLCSIKPQRWVLLPLLWLWQGSLFHGHFGQRGG